MQTVLGEQPCPILGKNPLTASDKRKRRFLESRRVCRGGGGFFSYRFGRVVKAGRAGNFSVNFIGSGFCDG